MKCSKEGESIAYCCRAEHFYNKATAKCEKLYDPYDPCMADICPDGYKEGMDVATISRNDLHITARKWLT